ncbi:glycosyltransferase [Thalassomonas haliotis]|uniref:Glycosyltransferase n=1 Tax=Thalassomonas haliotis TaxID=485448 RepID=A0ABY7VIG4_9GAMM|nr:glycosyltransferase [Thalassomonas haliotis]WDE13275.1 glycosyltransferase [Thalassomonas haliotis]
MLATSQHQLKLAIEAYEAAANQGVSQSPLRQQSVLAPANVTTADGVEKPGVTVSLTSYGRRVETVHLTLLSLLQQTYRADRLILWLAEDEFTLETLPRPLLALLECGVEIIFCPDLRSYKKLIPALARYPEDIIITFDDDIIYPQDQVERLIKAHEQDPGVVVCHRGHKALKTEDGSLLPYTDWHFDLPESQAQADVFPIGIGGVLYPVNSLHPEVMKESVFMTLCPNADDLWFKAMALKNGTLAKVLEDPMPYLDYLQIPDSQELSLWQSNSINNDVQLQAILTAYPELNF